MTFGEFRKLDWFDVDYKEYKVYLILNIFSIYKILGDKDYHNINIWGDPFEQHIRAIVKNGGVIDSSKHYIDVQASNLDLNEFNACEVEKFTLKDFDYPTVIIYATDHI